MSAPRFPNAFANLSGTSGNVGSIMGAVTRALKEAGEDEKTCAEFRAAVFDCGSYDEVLRLCMAWVDVG